MTDDRKTAEAAVKAAEKAWSSASSKASKTREVYLEAQTQANAAARRLTYAKANPVLFDDDPLEVVEPGSLSGIVIESSRGTAGQVTFKVPTQQTEIHTLPAATPPAEVLEQRQAEVTQQAAADEINSMVPPESDDEPPWEQPVPEAAPAPKKRQRRIAPKVAEPEAPPVDVTDLPEAPPEEGDFSSTPVAPGDPLSPF